MAERGKNTGGKGRQKPVIVPDMGRLQPQARELEEAVLGALMLEKDAYSYFVYCSISEAISVLSVSCHSSGLTFSWICSKTTNKAGTIKI